MVNGMVRCKDLIYVPVCGSDLSPPPTPFVIGEIYFMGIIDILQQYNTKKSIETFVKGFYLDKNEISSVNPEAYAARFCNWIDKNSC